MTLSPDDVSQINALLDARLKQSRHTADDHLNGGLLPIKLAAGNTAADVPGSGNTLVVATDGKTPTWTKSAVDVDGVLAFRAQGYQGGSAGANTYILPGGQSAWLGASGCAGAANFAPGILLPAVTGRTIQLNVFLSWISNATAYFLAGTDTLKFGLHLITGAAGASGSLSVTLNASQVSGSVVTVTGPGASTGGQASSGWFTAPTSGQHFLTVITTAASQAAAMFSTDVSVFARYALT